MPVVSSPRVVAANHSLLRRFVSPLVLIAMLLATTQSPAQDDDEDFFPGVEARYSLGRRTVTRVDPEINFLWDTAAPDPRLPTGSFTAVWTTTLLIRQPGHYRFHAYTVGNVTATLDGKSILSGARQTPGWVSSGEISLGFGEKPLEITFRKTEPTARLRLFWSSDRFPLEPLPVHQLFREDGNPRWKQFDRGRQAFTAHRCNRCHHRPNDPAAAAAPALTHLRGGLSRQWLVAKIRDPHTSRSDANMPSFGFSAKQADAIAAFLLASSRPVTLEHPVSTAGTRKDRGKKGRKKQNKPLSPRQQQRQGEILFRSTGCLACHTVGKTGTTGPYTGGDLSRIGGKRSRDWLYTWLARPATLNADHRMPVFQVTATERLYLAAYLSQLGRTKTAERNGSKRHNARTPSPQHPNNTTADGSGLVAEGRRLVQAARCAACHRINGIPADLTGIPDLSQPIADWAKSCVQNEADPAHRRPGYSRIDRKSLTAYITSRTGKLSPEDPSTRGRRVLQRRNCLQCHQRGLTNGIVPIAGKIARIDSALGGQSQRMIPPALTAVGDKLKDVVLAEAVGGRQKQLRLPWLLVRMPRFDHSADDRAALLTYLVNQDRIPAHAPENGDSQKPTSRLTRSQALVAGQTLVGPRGFSCTGCHILGSFHPRNVALGTRGSDLAFLGRRMRREFYTRWVRSPLRILPGTEMPSYIKPVAGVLDGHSRTQLAAIWDALNDPRFKPPTDPSVVEQLLAVAPGRPARIVRDVFTNPKENGGGYVPRALAIGLNNGHNILYDLDRFAVRGWTFGEFARQRTQGKSWYWDPAGLPVMTGFGSASDFALRPRAVSPAQLIHPVSRYGTNGRLRSYRRDGDGIVFKYWLSFKVSGSVRSHPVRERIGPVRSPDGMRTGWERRITASLTGLKDFDLLVARPEARTSAGSPTIKQVGSDKPSRKPGVSRRWFVASAEAVRKSSGDADRRTVTLRYLSSLKPERAALNLKPKPPLTKIKIRSVPGFNGTRLPLNPKIMPTAMAWTADGHLAFTSLEGHVYIAHDSNGDGVQDKLTLFEEGLAAPYGIIADGRDLIVAHKPELLRLRDTDGDGRADRRIVLATGWGYTDNYHDWTCGIVRDSSRNLYVGLGSDYAQRDRPAAAMHWRGTLLRIDPRGQITPLGFALRYPTGLAIDAHDNIFVSDNQGVQNTFNEINFLMPGHHYGVPSRNELDRGFPETPPAVQIPHPWTRSVNGLTILPSTFGYQSLTGAGLGCEYNGRFLVRFSYEKVAGTMQGAVYAFSRSDLKPADPNFLGPLCIAVSPTGDLYVGSIYDSGWLGGHNTGEIVRLRPNGRLPNGIRELRARSDGFEIEFFAPVNRQAAARRGNYSLSAYTRVWKGGYATPDSGRHTVAVKSATVAADARTVRLQIGPMRSGYVYDITCGRIGTGPNPALWPATGHYTLHRIPPAVRGAKTVP